MSLNYWKFIISELLEQLIELAGTEFLFSEVQDTDKHIFNSDINDNSVFPDFDHITLV